MDCVNCMQCGHLLSTNVFCCRSVDVRADQPLHINDTLQSHCNEVKDVFPTYCRGSSWSVYTIIYDARKLLRQSNHARNVCYDGLCDPG